MISRIITSFAVVALATNASAQTPQQAAVTLQPATSSTTLSYTMGEGYEIVSQAQRSGPETIFNNRGGLVYYYTYVTATDEYVDEGSFPMAGVSTTEQANGMTFDYCSASAGSADVTVEIRLYSETIGFVGVTGWVDANNRNEACGYLVAGLPGGGGGGALQCWTVGLNLTGGFECTLPQEQTLGGAETFGWSIMYSDALLSGVTGPLIGPTSGYGVQDYFEYYDMTQPLGAEYLGTFWFGGGGRAQANFSMSLDGNPTDTAAYYSANPGTADIIDLQAGVEVRANQAANWTITNPTAGSSYALLASIGSSDLPGLASGNAHLLVDWLGAPLLPAPVVMPGGGYSQIMPAALPPSLFVQAAEYSGALRPSNITAMSNGLNHSN